MSFADYRFAIKARLNLLPTKTVARRAGKNPTDTMCPVCHQQPDTLAHCLNACMPQARMMTDRHNKILNRLVRAIPKSPTKTITVNQKNPGLTRHPSTRHGCERWQQSDNC
jgi:hypothetical protein